MKRRSRLMVPIVMIVALTMGLQSPARAGDDTEPYGNDVTAKIADTLNGRDRVGWHALTLDIGGYTGKRHAEIVKIRAGHGKRWIGIIHVPNGKAQKARNALGDVWLGQRGTRFVVPLQTKTDTDGCVKTACKTAARWAVKRLGNRWKLK